MKNRCLLDDLISVFVDARVPWKIDQNWLNVFFEDANILHFTKGKHYNSFHTAIKCKLIIASSTIKPWKSGKPT